MSSERANCASWKFALRKQKPNEVSNQRGASSARSSSACFSLRGLVTAWRRHLAEHPPQAKACATAPRRQLILAWSNARLDAGSVDSIKHSSAGANKCNTAWRVQEVAGESGEKV